MSRWEHFGAAFCYPVGRGESAARKCQVRFEVLAQRQHHRLPPSEQHLLIIDNDGEYICEDPALWVAESGVAYVAITTTVEICRGLTVQKLLAGAASQAHHDVALAGGEMRVVWRRLGHDG